MKLLKHLILLGFTLVIFIGSYYCIDFYIKDNVNLYLHMDVKSEISDDYQIFSLLLIMDGMRPTQ